MENNKWIILRNKGFGYLPEICFIIFFGYWFPENYTGEYVKYLSVLFIGIILLEMVWKNKMYSIILSCILSLISVIMLYNLIPVFDLIPPGDSEALKSVFTNWILFTGLAGMAIIMPWKYMPKNKLIYSY